MATTKKPLSPMDALTLIEKLMSASFDKPRDPRSDAYKRGVRELLKHRAAGMKYSCPYKLGTAEADAFFSGSDEGNHIWRQHLDSEG